MDKEVLREIWHGQLPLCFKLHDNDVDGMHRPEPYYMMASRVTYFPLVLDRVVKYFTRFMDQSKQPQATNDIWLDFDGQPIKWQHPIGLSWDLFGSNYDLPWNLILHFSDFPAKELIRCNTKASIETNFISSIKEADALKHKGAVIKNMVKKDHNQLWSGLMNDKFEQFWSINKRLMERLDSELFRYIPFRLYFPDYTYIQKTIRPCTTDRLIFHNGTVEETNSSSDWSQKVTSVPLVYEYDTNNVVMNKTHKCSHLIFDLEGNECNSVEPIDPNLRHRCSTMLDLIQISFKNKLDDLLIPKQQSTTGAQEVDEVSDFGGCKKTAVDAATKAFATMTCDDPNQGERKEQAETEKLISVEQFKYRFMSHGVEIPFDAPLQWLSEHLSYPDNFLHICAVIKENIEYL